MTTTKIKHPYHDILQAISLGKQIQWQTEVGVWVHEGAAAVLAEIVDEDFPPERYRAKPDTVTINGIEVERPMTEAPAINEIYWYAFVGQAEGFASDIWTDHAVDHDRMASGLCWTTEAGVAGAIHAFKSALTA